MKLIVVRHAAAGTRNPLIWPNDGERPLTRKGRARFVKAAQGIARLAPDVDLMLSSPYTRAWDTAKILKEEAGWPAPQICDELRDNSPEAVVQVLEPYRAMDTVALVGHEPYLSQLAGHLLAPGANASMELKKGAAACLDLPPPDAERGARLLWLLQPKALGRMA